MTDRRFPRIDSRHSVLVKKLDGDTEGFATTKSVGGGGCSFLSSDSFGVDSNVELLIVVDREIVRARCRVVYELDQTDGRVEVGVAFSDRLAAPDADRIAALLAGT